MSNEIKDLCIKLSMNKSTLDLINKLNPMALINSGLDVEVKGWIDDDVLMIGSYCAVKLNGTLNLKQSINTLVENYIEFCKSNCNCKF